MRSQQSISPWRKVARFFILDTVLVKKQTQKTAQRLWEDEESGKDMSDLIEQLMVDWIVAQSA
jgi:hypothetical protein